MSTPANFDSEIISQTDGAQSSQVPIPLSDDHYMAVRQSHLVDTDTESGPLKDLKETKIPHPLPSAPSLVPPLDNLYLIVRQTHTPATIDTKSEPKEAPLETEEFEAFVPSDTRITSPYSTSPLDSTTPLSPDHPLAQTSPASTRASYYHSTVRMVVCTQPTLSPGMSARIVKATALSPSLFRKRYQGTSKLVEDTEDESSNSDTERGGSEEDGLGSEEEVATTEIPTSVASPVTTLVTNIVVGEDEFLEVGAQLKLQGSILYDHTQRLDALPPTLFEGYDRDLRELYTRSREVRDEIFS
ncbi:hypothetical protein Tco_1204779 [Tanacetum coccineum]